VRADPEVSRPSPARPDRRAARRQETTEQIVAAAWDLVREHGLAGLSMRDLGERVGMRPQSVYSYFASKHEIYDAMFREGYRDFAADLASVSEVAGDVAHTVDGRRETARGLAHGFFDFCTSDPVRYQLLFQRTIPDFVPSAESWAVALETYDAMRVVSATFGLTDAEDLDLWTAVLTGLTDQQISNDPGGDRWERLIDRAVDMVLREIVPDRFEPTERSP
jgi:AcrR family transcriptional regulator